MKSHNSSPSARPSTDSDFAAPLRYWAERASGRPFLRVADGGAVLTFGHFHRHVRELAGALRRAGLRSGESCVIHTGNGPEFMHAFWALQELGAVAVPTIAQYTADELGFVVRHCGAWGVICTPPLLGVARKATARTDCRLLLAAEQQVAGVESLTELPGGAPPPRPPAGGREPALVLYTSGTTARPKGVVLGHAGSLFTASSYAAQLRLRGDDTVLACMPLFHVNGLFLQMAAALYGGCGFVLAERFSASRYWSWVERHEVTVGHLVAGPVRLLLAAADAPERHRVRVISFGLPLAATEIVAFERRFAIPLRMVWGSTETCCGGTMMPLDFGARPGTQRIGPAMAGWEVEAVREDGSRCAPGELGELVVRSPGVMLGYHRDPEATAATLRDGWVHTGDLGRRDADGYFEFVDRIKDMLKPSGENVAASEVEAALSSHPAVRECAVVGVPDPVRSERIVAFVVVAGADDDDPPPAAELIAHCGERLAAFKLPAQVEFRTELPRTSIGKVRKGELRASLAPPG